MDKKQQNMTPESAEFLSSLHEEKLKHKQHRVDFVKQKLVFTIGLFSIGSLHQIQLGNGSIILSDLLLLVPFVALAFDIYIFAEDFKIKRIGIFIFDKCKPSKEEKWWEDWLSLPKHREQTALVASVMLTIVALVAALHVLHAFVGLKETVSIGFLSSNPENIFWWFLLSSASIGLAFETTTYLRDELVLPKRNRLSTPLLFVGLLFALVGIVLFVLIAIKYRGFEWRDYLSIYPTLFSGIFLAVWLTTLQRVRREISWRHSGRFSLVEFKVRPNIAEEVDEVYLCGDFTRWEVNEIKMIGQADGCFDLTIALEAGKHYEFKYRTYRNDGKEHWLFEDGNDQLQLIKEQGQAELNEGWNDNSIIFVNYTKYKPLVGTHKYKRNLYS